LRLTISVPILTAARVSQFVVDFRLTALSATATRSSVAIPCNGISDAQSNDA
jgi:hypothetical protein